LGGKSVPRGARDRKGKGRQSTGGGKTRDRIKNLAEKKAHEEKGLLLRREKEGKIANEAG